MPFFKFLKEKYHRVCSRFSATGSDYVQFGGAYNAGLRYHKGSGSNSEYLLFFKDPQSSHADEVILFDYDTASSYKCLIRLAKDAAPYSWNIYSANAERSPSSFDNTVEVGKWYIFSLAFQGSSQPYVRLWCAESKKIIAEGSCTENWIDDSDSGAVLRIGRRVQSADRGGLEIAHFAAFTSNLDAQARIEYLSDPEKVALDHNAVCYYKLDDPKRFGFDSSKNGNHATVNSTVAPREFPSEFLAKDEIWFPVSSAEAGAITGTIAETLDDFTSTASGSLEFIGSSAETLEDFTSAASGTHEKHTGTIAETLEDFTGAAVGAVAEFIGSLAETLEDFSPSASGHLTYSGTSTETLADFTSTASGTVAGGAVTGTVAETLEDYSSSAEGTVANPVTGDIAITMADFIASAAGTVPGVGTGISGGNYGRIIGITLPPRRKKEEKQDAEEIPAALEPITEAEVQRAIEANMSLVPRIMEQAFVPRSQAIVMLRAQIEEDLERQRQDNFRQTTGLQLDFISNNLRTLMTEMDDIKAIMTLLLAK